MEDIEVFYMDPAFIDPQVYDLWLRGFSGDFPNLFSLMSPTRAILQVIQRFLLKEDTKSVRQSKAKKKKIIIVEKNIYVKIIIVSIVIYSLSCKEQNRMVCEWYLGLILVHVISKLPNIMYQITMETTPFPIRIA